MLRVVDAVNASPVGALLAGRRRRELATTDLRAAFDAAFGPGRGSGCRCIAPATAAGR